MDANALQAVLGEGSPFHHSFITLDISVHNAGVRVDGHTGASRRFRTLLAVTGPCNIEFPRDHGQHPGYRSEWWYYTGNLKTKTGERFGFQLTFFRSQISPPGEEASWPKPASAWRTQQLYLAHAAVTDIDGKNYYHAETISRGVDGIAGVRQEGGKTTVFLRSWSVQIMDGAMKLSAADEKFSISLALTLEKPAVLHGDGATVKKVRPRPASCYYSFTRLATAGEISIGDKRYSVSGLSWMDHEFSTEPLEPGLVGWDWFSLQLDDGTELMVFLLRRREGGIHPASSGTFVDRDGKAVHLSSSEFSVDILTTGTVHTPGRGIRPTGSSPFHP